MRGGHKPHKGTIEHWDVLDSRLGRVITGLVENNVYIRTSRVIYMSDTLAETMNSRYTLGTRAAEGGV